MSMTITIAGTPVAFDEDTFHLKQLPDESWRCQFTVLDYAGTAVYSYRQHVLVTDPALGRLFEGYVIDDQQDTSNTYPDPTIEHKIDTVDNTSLAGKRTSNKLYANQYAGVIAADMVQRTLSSEGVTGPFALRWDEQLTDWQQGTLTGVSATTNASDSNSGDGDVELSPAGTLFTSAFASGSLTTNAAIAFSGVASTITPNPLVRRVIWTGSISTSATDSLSFSVWVSSTSPSIVAGLDYSYSDGTTFLGTGGFFDGQNLSNDPTTDLSGLANDQWYTRTFSVTGLGGKTITSVSVVLAGKQAGTYNTYFQNISYTNGTTHTTTTIFTSTLNANIPGSNVGYSNVTLSAVQVTGAPSQQLFFSPGTYSAVGLLKSSLVTWNQVVPPGTSLVIESSIDGQASWQALTSGNAIPNLLPGTQLARVTLSYRATLSVSSDPTQTTLGFSGFQTTLTPSYAMTKTDLLQSYGNGSGAIAFSAGTLTNTQVVGSELTLAGFSRNYNALVPGVPADQSFFGTLANTLIQAKQLLIDLNNTSGTDAKSRMDPAGQWQNFTLECDVQVPDAAVGQAGLCYRTTAWNTTNNTYAYNIMVSSTSFQFARGSNSTSGSFTNIQSVTVALTAGSTHRIKAVVNGNSHIFSLDGVQLISQTDATFPNQGYIGMRVFQGSASRIDALFNNFAVRPALSGTWQSSALNVSSPGTYGTSAVAWDIDGIPDSSCSISMQSSVDGGSTFQNVTNGGAIPNLTAGQSLAAKTLILKATLTAGTAPTVPLLNGLSVLMLQQYSSSGTRSTAPLAWDSATRANVASGWGTATDGQTWTQVGTATTSLTSNELVTTNPTSTAEMVIGSHTSADTSATVRLSLSSSAINGAGIHLRRADSSNYYRMQISTTGVLLRKVVAGGVTTLATASMTLTTSTFYWLRFVVVGTTLNARLWADGTTEPMTWTATATDATFASGGFALFGNGTGTIQFDHMRVTQYPDPGIALLPVGRAANALVAWNATTPTNTSLAVQTSVDNGVSWQTVAASGNTVPNISVAPATITDSFATNTSANYTQSTFASGTTGSWTWDTTNSRLVGTGGTNGTLAHNPALTSADSYVVADLDSSDGSGLIANYIDTNNLYFLQLWDASGTGTQSSAKLFKRSGGSTVQLGTTAPITFVRGTYKRITLDVQAGVVTAKLDGAILIQVTDGSPLGAGKCGLLLGTLMRCYDLIIQQYGQLMTWSNFLYSRVTLTSTDPTVTPQLLDKQEFVSASSIGIGTLIPQADYRETFLDKNFGDIGKQSNAIWYIDQFKQFNFYQRQVTLAPWIAYSTTTGTSVDIEVDGNLLVDIANDLYRNHQVLTGVIGSNAFTDTFIGNGQATSFTLRYPVAPATVPVITLNGLAQTIAKKGGSGAQWYYAEGDPVIAQDTSGTALRINVDSLTAAYMGTFITSVTEDNLSAQTTLAAIEGGSGIVEAVEDVSARNMTVAAATTYAQQLITRYCLTGRTFTYGTYRTGLQVGMLQPAFVPEENMNDVQLQILAMDITMRTQPNNTQQYYAIVTASELPPIGTWQKLIASGLLD